MMLPMTCIVKELCSFGKYLTYTITPRPKPQVNPPVNTLNLLMQARDRQFPTDVVEKNNKDKMLNMLLLVLKDTGALWSTTSIASGNKFINQLLDCLWTVSQYLPI